MTGQPDSMAPDEVEGYLSQLDDPDPMRRWAAAFTLGRQLELAVDVQVVRRLARAAEDEDEMVAKAAAAAVSHYRHHLKLDRSGGTGSATATGCSGQQDEIIQHDPEAGLTRIDVVILRLLERSGRGLTAGEIAERCNEIGVTTTHRSVTACLYGALKGLVSQDEERRWTRGVQHQVLGGTPVAGPYSATSLAERRGKPRDSSAKTLANAKAMGSPTKPCPRCGGSMVVRHATRGRHAGDKFWGCASYPMCKYLEAFDG